MKPIIKKIQNEFHFVCDLIFSQLNKNEIATLNLHAEDTDFVRFNNSKIRQTTSVLQKQISLHFVSEGKTLEYKWPLTGVPEQDRQNALLKLGLARKEIEQLPLDPHLVFPESSGQSEHNFVGKKPSTEELINIITESTTDVDLAGLLCTGIVISAHRNSLGPSHWFSTDSFFLDYSLYDGTLAVKGTYAGSEWQTEKWLEILTESQAQLALMHKPKQSVKPGTYRVYLAPAAISEIINHVGFPGSSAFSQRDFQRGTSAFKKLGDRQQKFSEFFSFKENFELGLMPSFNWLGECSDAEVSLIEKGELKQFLLSTRTAKEFNLKTNFAADHEGPRSPEIAPGDLNHKDILKKLETGLYLSNLHYINWSDKMSARITGMTRYACFWVENGEIIGPITDLRFDVSLYDIFGSSLEAVTSFQEVSPVIDTYSQRGIGGQRIPGFLISSFKFTL